MTNAELLTKIREEVERKYLSTSDSRDRWNYGYDTACEEILSFLSTLESEKQMQEGLEEEIKRYGKEEMPVVLESDLNDIARHFAQWGADHFRDTTKMVSGSSEIPNDLEEAAEKKYPVYWKDYPKDGIARSELSYDTNKQCRDAFIAGAKWDREQMMKEAVKWLVDDDYDPKTEKGRFILGSVGIGYNGYYIPYIDLLKLPKEDEK